MWMLNKERLECLESRMEDVDIFFMRCEIDFAVMEANECDVDPDIVKTMDIVHEDKYNKDI